MNLDEWAKRWGISAEALLDLRGVFGQLPVVGNTGSDQSEGQVQAQIRLAASAKGVKLFRNNVGAGKLDNGSFVRWGLCNDSAALNAQVKSSDLIGIRPVLIEPRHVGSLVGQFVAREVKRPGWRYVGNAREMAQLRFIEWVSAHGGDARFTCSPEGDL